MKGASSIVASEWKSVITGITFKHKVGKVSFQLSSSLLINTLLGEQVEAELGTNSKNNPNNAFKVGKISLFDGTTSEIVPVAMPNNGKISFKVADANNPRLWEASFYTVEPGNLTQLNLVLKKLPSKKPDGTLVELLAPSTNTSIFTFATPTIGKNLIGNVNLMNTMPEKYILHGDTIDLNYSQHTYAAGQPLWLFGNYRASDPYHSGYMGDGTRKNSLDNSGSYAWAERFNYLVHRAIGGWMGYNFVIQSPNGTPTTLEDRRRYYEKGNIKVKDYFIHRMAESSSVGSTNPQHANYGDKYTVAKQMKIQGGRYPDLVILSHRSLSLNQADNDALIGYVQNHKGTVIIFSGHGSYTNLPGRNPNTHLTSLPFLRHFFGQSMNVVAEKLAHTDLPTFQFTDVNDPVLNGYYGDIRGTYWGANIQYAASWSLPINDVGIAYATGLNPNDIINYSSLKPETPISKQPPVGSFLVFRHKTHKIYFVGTNDFLSAVGHWVEQDKWLNTVTAFNEYGDYTAAYSNLYKSNMAWAYPITQTNVRGGLPLNNSKFFTNMVVSALANSKE